MIVLVEMKSTAVKFRPCLKVYGCSSDRRLQRRRMASNGQTRHSQMKAGALRIRQMIVKTEQKEIFMKKNVFLLAAIFTASALTGCGSDPENIALGMAKAVAAGDAEKLASYCSPEFRDHCNAKYAKWFIEAYQKNFAAMKKYYPKAQEPEFAIGQKKHMDYKQLGGPELDEVLVLDVKNRPSSKDDPSDWIFKFEIIDNGAAQLYVGSNYRDWKYSSEKELRALGHKALQDEFHKALTFGN